MKAGKDSTMRITDLLDKDSILLTAAPSNKTEALTQAVALMAKSGRLSDEQAYQKQVFAREEESTTGIGEGIAIPHGKCSAVKQPGLAAMVIPNGVDFDSLDGEPVTLLFLIAAPDTKENVHLDVLSKLSVLLMDETFTARLRSAKQAEEFLQIIDEADSKQAGIDERLKQNSTGFSKILAVTSCPTGIAHTYMAAEALEKAASKAGCTIKIETRGSGGAKNVLTAQEIAEADCILVAADTRVPMERFHQKPVIECQVSDGISKADELIARALQKDAPLYQADSRTDTPSHAVQSSSLAHQLYRQLMNGVSHMLPFVVGGGILIAIAFLIDGQSVELHLLSDAERAAFGTITPTAAFFKNLGGTAFGLMLPVLAGFIAEAIADRPGLALGFVGGMLAANGKSGFLGALAAGFLAGYVILLLRQLCSKLPESLEKLAPVLFYPVFGILLMGIGMSLLIEPVMGTINTALNSGLASMSGSSKIFLGFLLAAMMAVDMGGPFNKAAYVFGTASIAAGNYDIMAAVMIGGMVPPCAIALATMLFADKFTKEERQSGPTNFIMGLAFITEGAIPFAASDPLHVIPACILGAGLSGALSELFGCTLMAPHGGIFVFPVVGNALLYLAALAAGTFVSTLLLGAFKKKKTNHERGI